MSQRVTITVVVLTLLGAAGFWYWQSQREDATSLGQISQEQPGGFGAQIFEKTENPTKDEFPEANPFAADSNPFDANTNPYKDEYRNPFE